MRRNLIIIVCIFLGIIGLMLTGNIIIIGEKLAQITHLWVAEYIFYALTASVIGGVAGYFMGYGFAQIIGHTVFASSIEMKPMVIPIVVLLIVLVTLAGSIPAIRMLLRLRPAEVLHGR